MRISFVYIFLCTFSFIDAAMGASPQAPPINIVTSKPVSISINLTSHFNNKGVSENPGGANLDGQGGGYPLNELPAAGSILQYRGINFTLPDWSASSDNILSEGQVLNVTAARFQSLHLLAAADGSTIYTNNITVSYADGSQVSQPVLVPYWKTNRGPVNVDFSFTSTGIDGNSSHMHYFQVPLNAEKTLTSVTIPSGTVDSSRFHVFALSLFTSSSLFTTGHNAQPVNNKPGPALTFQYIRSRNQWYNDSALQTSSVETTALSFMKVLEKPSPKTIVQVVEVAINNLPQSFNTSSWLNSPHTVEISSPGLQTIYTGRLSRLRAGDQARIKVGVTNKPGITRGSKTKAKAIVKDENGHIVATSEEWEVEAGITIYDSTLATLQKHEAPKWFEDSKFGIFVHWGVYSVPAFAPSGQQYAEWYWWQLHNPNNTNSPTWVYHQETYGKEFVYDEFIPKFNPTAANWSADVFTDLFAESGAKCEIIFRYKSLPNDANQSPRFCFGH